MKTSTVLIITLGFMHVLTLINILLFEGMFDDIVFFFNTAFFFFALAFYSWRKGKPANNQND
ncbi:hypothetical protein ACSFXN_06675 [Planococcus sp. 1R117A]|uniref:hypothetical protein n=1 Tax=Planococcus sp. 1R117A TaxID=3447020 RepID=UPI003EDC8CEE